jgi:hypothetical protein
LLIATVPGVLVPTTTEVEAMLSDTRAIGTADPEQLEPTVV